MMAKHTASILPALGTATLLSSCVAGRIDRVEDRYDRRENGNDKLRGRCGLYC